MTEVTVNESMQAKPGEQVGSGVKIEGGNSLCGAEFLRESIKKAEEISVPILKEVGLYVGQN